MGECMKKWFIALVCASTFLFAQDALAAIQFKRFAHCGDGLVTVKTLRTPSCAVEAKRFFLPHLTSPKFKMFAAVVDKQQTNKSW